MILSARTQMRWRRIIAIIRGLYLFRRLFPTAALAICRRPRRRRVRLRRRCRGRTVHFRLEFRRHPCRLFRAAAGAAASL